MQAHVQYVPCLKATWRHATFQIQINAHTDTHTTHTHIYKHANTRAVRAYTEKPHQMHASFHIRIGIHTHRRKHNNSAYTHHIQTHIYTHIHVHMLKGLHTRKHTHTHMHTCSPYTCLKASSRSAMACAKRSCEAASVASCISWTAYTPWLSAALRYVVLLISVLVCACT